MRGSVNKIYRQSAEKIRRERIEGQERGSVNQEEEERGNRRRDAEEGRWLQRQTLTRLLNYACNLLNYFNPRAPLTGCTHMRMRLRHLEFLSLGCNCQVQPGASTPAGLINGDVSPSRGQSSEGIRRKLIRIARVPSSLLLCLCHSLSLVQDQDCYEILTYIPLESSSVSNTSHDHKAMDRCLISRIIGTITKM